MNAQNFWPENMTKTQEKLWNLTEESKRHGLYKEGMMYEILGRVLTHASFF